jgi:hypothetical protein
MRPDHGCRRRSARLATRIAQHPPNAPRRPPAKPRGDRAHPVRRDPDVPIDASG